jgi:hypothetical protein
LGVTPHIKRQKAQIAGASAHKNAKNALVRGENRPYAHAAHERHAHECQNRAKYQRHRPLPARTSRKAKHEQHIWTRSKADSPKQQGKKGETHNKCLKFRSLVVVKRFDLSKFRDFSIVEIFDLFKFKLFVSIFKEIYPKFSTCKGKIPLQAPKFRHSR